ncbi:DEAD/DEAH box helicase [Oceanobacillus bengalensis]|uniref:Helicase SNF n=1 Tax=Oceanobacillus bengalensis TaxID=1435466 RepID=A0A494YZF9_9BACI|nr:DEAD/DEAH box helicase [Oceanobacillus bengalensis]RKQ15548.1 helicase SNF [Oceanobacillus bengalensis]
MQTKLNPKIIKERCGTVSFKRGDAFYRNGKVSMEKRSPKSIEATVEGIENFHVTLEKDKHGKLQTACSCPRLSSYNKDCQHIAAVLIALHDQKNQRTDGSLSDGEHPHQTTEELSDKLLSLFQEPSVQQSSHQRHFENREIIDITFLCKPVTVEMQKTMFGIELTVDQAPLLKIRDFLEKVRAGKSYHVSTSKKYDPVKHCFQTEADRVIQELIQVMDDQKMYQRAIPSKFIDDSMEQLILIPASSWERIEPLLVKVPSVVLEYDGKRYRHFQLSDETLPLKFEFEEAKAEGYQLRINGFNRMFVMRDYHTVLFNGKLIPMKRDDTERLSELKRMLENSGTNEIPIREAQMKYFMEKLVPALRKMGEIHLSGAITKRLRKTPLSAKLYLDRVKDRLLAGLEFQYENVIINPLDKRESQVGSMIIRDTEKEKEILQIIEDSQFNETESGYYFHNEALEYNFLYHELPKIQKLAQVYATTAVRTRIIPKNPRPRIRVKHKKERTNWLEFTFDMDGIPQKEIKEVLVALEEKRKYYRLKDGALLSLETREMEEISRFLNAVPMQDEEFEKGIEVPVIKGLRLLDSVGDSDTISIEASFRDFLESIYHPEQLKSKVPERLDNILRNYQKQGYRWMKQVASYGFGGILADDMGLGKTIQSITFIVSELKQIREGNKPVLIVCPSSLTYNWQAEIMKFSPEIQAIIMDGKKVERTKLQKEIKDMDVLITSYPLLRSDIIWYEKQEFHTVFFDEAQVFKNPMTQTARAVKKLNASHRFALTGTPIENSLEELWSIFHVVFPELFLGLKEYSNLTKKQISRRIRPFMLRRVKEDVLHELPGKNETIVFSELLPEQKTLYASYLAKLRHETLKHLDKETIRKNRIKILAGLTRLRQICCHPALFIDGYEGESAKFRQLMQIAQESKFAGRRVLIFSQFTKMLQLIGKEFAYQGRSFFYLDGKTPSEERIELCNRFNKGERDIFLISLKAGGTGLNLTGADTVIFYDSWWNPAVEEQAADRAHRIGQRHSVEVIKLVAKGTIEEKMNDLQDKKRHLIEEIIDPKERSVAKLTEEDIQDLLG